MGRAKPEHAEEWAALIEKFCERSLDDKDRDRLDEISVPAYECVGAPCVGRDKAADDYALTRKPKDSQESDAEFLVRMEGYYALELVRNCDGVPKYSMGALSPAVDQTSFRGKALEFCDPILGDLGELAWSNMRPAEAVAYGEKLLAAAQRARRGEVKLEAPPPEEPVRKRRLFGLLPPKPAREAERPETGGASLEVQIDIVECAGRWYLYWGRAGHPIWAYY